MGVVHEGVCPKCKEWTEVSAEDNGCCNRGCYIDGDGSLIEAEEVENDEKESAAELIAEDMRIDKYFGGN